MEVLHATLGGAAFALPLHQVVRVRPWPDEVDFPVAALDASLGLTAAAPAQARLLEVGGGGARAGFLVPADLPLNHRAAPAASLYRLPWLLGRLSPPAWLYGLFAAEDGLSLIVDLERLALQLLEAERCPR